MVPEEHMLQHIRALWAKQKLIVLLRLYGAYIYAYRRADLGTVAQCMYTCKLFEIDQVPQPTGSNVAGHGARDLIKPEHQKGIISVF
jgi:hypothetical protein